MATSGLLVLLYPLYHTLSFTLYVLCFYLQLTLVNANVVLLEWRCKRDTIILKSFIIPIYIYYRGTLLVLESNEKVRNGRYKILFSPVVREERQRTAI